MVVLSVAIVAQGKTLIARQFVEMTRVRVEGLLSAFPKLVDSGRDHTFIETETVRYVYQPMEALYLVVITNRSSNILEDLETLRLLAKVVQDCCQIQVNEELVLKHSFDIVFAFDEVISFGHRESVTLSQIKTYTEMDSHEEKLHQMIEQSKINEARETAKKKQLELAKLHASKPKEDKMTGFGSSGGGGPSSDSAPSPAKTLAQVQESMGPSSGMNSGASDWNSGPMSMGASNAPTIQSSAPKKGMMLGKKRPGDGFGGAPAAAAAEVAPENSPAGAVAESPKPAAVNPLLDPVKVDIEEKITANLQAEGGLVGEAECVGQFQVTVIDAAKADLVCFKLQPQDQSFKYKVHPNLNKASQANNILEVREPEKRFRANTPAPLLKWRFASTNEDFLPISLSCWPSSTADGTQIVLEFELTDNSICLEDVHIRFPCPPSARPNISSAEPGEAQYDAGSQQVHWYIPTIDKNESSGTFEFSASADISSLLPYTFEATRRGETKCPVNILECYHQERKDALNFHLEKSCQYVFTVGQ